MLSPSPSSEVDLSASTQVSPSPAFDASPKDTDLPDDMGELLAEAVATRNELEEMQEDVLTASPIVEETTIPAEPLEEFPNAIAELIAEAVATRNELEEIHKGNPTPMPSPSPTPSPAPTPSPEPEPTPPTPSPSPVFEASPSPTPELPENLVDAVADLR